MDLIGQAIMDAADRLRVAVRPPEGDNTLDCIVTARSGRWIMVVFWNETGETTVAALVPVFVPPGRIAETNEFIRQVNAKVPYGQFELKDERIGEIWFVLTCDVCKYGVPSQDLAFKAMQQSCNTVDQHLPELMKVLFGGERPACQEAGVHPPCTN